MQRPVRTILLLVTLSLAVAAQQKTWRGSWTANSGSGVRTFGGTWDASLGDDQDTVVGNWTLVDKAGATVAAGTWAARKDEKIWRGSWQARGPSGGIYSGTWRAPSQAPPAALISKLFEFALAKVATGTWRMGTAYSGNWAIRAFPEQ
jgi:hypothetical protein